MKTFEYGCQAAFDVKTIQEIEKAVGIPAGPVVRHTNDKKELERLSSSSLAAALSQWPLHQSLTALFRK